MDEIEDIHSFSEDLIRTTRLLLRPLQPDDVDAVYRIRANPENTVYTRINSAPETPEITAQWIQKILADEAALIFVIELPPDIHPSAVDSAVTNGIIPNSSIIGLVGTFAFPEIGYILNKPYWGKGYATEALQGYLDLFWNGVEPDEEDYVTAVVRVDHLASASVLKKCGFKLEGKEDSVDMRTGQMIEVQKWRMGRPKGAEGSPALVLDLPT